MNGTLYILKLMIPFGVVISTAVYLIWGWGPYFQIQSFIFLGCLVGALVAEGVQALAGKWKSSLMGVGFLVGAASRIIFPIIFLFFSLKFYHYPVDKNLQYVIIISYFAYYPLMLSACTSAAIARAKALQLVRDSQEESSPQSPRPEKLPADEVSESTAKAFDEEKR